MQLQPVLRQCRVAAMVLVFALTPLNVHAVSWVDGADTASIAATTLPNGVAAGDVTQNSVVLWTRSTATGNLIYTTPGGGRATHLIVDPDLPSKVEISGLAPGTRYTYSVTNAAGDSASGRFRTPAALGEQAGLRFGVSGDWRGDLAPYMAVSNAVERDLDFFVALGDTAYADVPSPAVPADSARSLADFRRKHDEVYGERHGANILGDLRASTIIFATIDDHEIVNDFAGGAPAASDARFAESAGLINDADRFEVGLQAFEEYNPIRAERYGVTGGDGRADGESKLYRYRTFGSDAAIFLLDARSFRDAPVSGPIDGDWAQFMSETYAANRTMLGGVQLAELKRDLLDAQAKGITWKFVVAPEPVQNLGPIGIVDRFEGYAAERTELLRFISRRQLTNVVFVAADVHGTIVNNLAYRDEVNGPAIPVDAFEVTTGPVAYSVPFGPAAVNIAENWGWISADAQAVYDRLPTAPDADSVPDDKDDFVKKVLNDALVWFDDDPVGLEGSSIDAQLLHGDYMVVHTFGWTEFDIDAVSQRLTVTTYGIPAYGSGDLARNAAAIAALEPSIVSQFVVAPQAGRERRAYLPLVIGQ